MKQADIVRDELKTMWAYRNFKSCVKNGVSNYGEFCFYHYKRKTEGFKHPLTFAEFLLSSTKDIDLYN